MVKQLKYVSVLLSLDIQKVGESSQVSFLLPPHEVILAAENG